MDYRIVIATPGDYATIQEIAHATWPDTFGDILSPEQIDYMLNMMYSEAAIVEQVAKGHIFKLLVAADTAGQSADYPKAATTRFKPVGYVSYQLDYLPGTTKIHKVYLLPETQGKGYGKALLQEVEKIARNAGQERLRLDVNYQNNAIGFYEYLGMQKIDRYNTDIGNGYLMEDWIMEKELNQE